MRRICGVAALLVLISACGGHTLAGSIAVTETMPPQQGQAIGEACTGLGGYSDINAGTSVVVKDDSGKILATGSLEAGKIVAADTCGFAFTIPNVPDASFYQVEVSHRGALTYSPADLDKVSWKVALTLGAGA